MRHRGFPPVAMVTTNTGSVSSSVSLVSMEMALTWSRVGVKGEGIGACVQGLTQAGAGKLERVGAIALGKESVCAVECRLR